MLCVVLMSLRDLARFQSSSTCWILRPSFFTVLFSIPVSHAFVVSFNALNPLPAPIVTQDNLHPEDKYCQQSHSTVLMYCPHSLYVVVVCPLLPSHFTWNGCQPRVSMMSRTRIRKWRRSMVACGLWNFPRPSPANAASCFTL